MVEIIDLTQEIFHCRPGTVNQASTAVWPFLTHASTRFRHGDISFASRGLVLSDHCGTHVDAFNHLDDRPDAPSIDQLPLCLFYSPANCLDFSGKGMGDWIEPDDLRGALARAGLEIRPGDAVLLRYGHLPNGLSPYDSLDRPDRMALLDRYVRGFPGMSRAAALWLADQGVINFACDARSIDHPSTEAYDADPPFPVHTVCRDRRILNTENLQIPARLAGRRFQFIGLPLKIRGGTGSPIRAIAVLS